MPPYMCAVYGIGVAIGVQGVREQDDPFEWRQAVAASNGC